MDIKICAIKVILSEKIKSILKDELIEFILR